jgi:hypothetical protein
MEKRNLLQRHASAWRCLGLAALVLGGAAHAQNNTGASCETLRAQIESRIAAAGVAQFSVTTVDASAPANGKVVGSCELGSKKIVYEVKDGKAPAQGSAAPKPARGPAIVTECRDGTVSMGGDCRK